MYESTFRSWCEPAPAYHWVEVKGCPRYTHIKNNDLYQALIRNNTYCHFQVTIKRSAEQCIINKQIEEKWNNEKYLINQREYKKVEKKM